MDFDIDDRRAHEPESEEESKHELRGRKADSSPERPRETSEERADKKRAELKRQLEEKAKAPTKKKRRF